jgi:Tfp pilus assembly protein PilX
MTHLTLERRRREGGSALFVAVMMLVLMGFLGIAALDRVTRDEQVAGFQNRARNAFWAAEAGIAAARDLVADPNQVYDRTATPTFPDQAAPQDVGDVATYDREAGLPRYYGDPAVAPDPPIRWAKDGRGGGAFGMNLQANQGGLKETLWMINVVGESPDGSRSRIEVLASVIMAWGYNN